MTTKQKVLEAVRKLPADSSIDDVMERLYLLYKIENGIKQARSGKKVSHRVAKERIKKWLR
jgi:hypothetical protein